MCQATYNAIEKVPKNRKEIIVKGGNLPIETNKVCCRKLTIDLENRQSIDIKHLGSDSHY